jgi:hypothetical protein
MGVEELTPRQWRDRAAEARTRSAESFERSDTDGFASQAANDLMAGQYDLAARIAENGGVWEFPALFDLGGNLVAAKQVTCYDSYKYRHVTRWVVLENDDPQSAAVKWVTPSQAHNPDLERRNNAKKGYYIGAVEAPAKAAMGGGGTGMAGMASCFPIAVRTDGGFSRDVEIIDNGR